MIVEIILGLVAITLGWTTFNLTRKVERLETWVEIVTGKQFIEYVFSI